MEVVRIPLERMCEYAELELARRAVAQRLRETKGTDGEGLTPGMCRLIDEEARIDAQIVALARTCDKTDYPK